MNQGMEIFSQASYLQGSNWFFEESKETKWTPEENKKFENALALFDKDTPDRWYNVAAMIPGKTVYDVIKQYRELEEDVSDIEAGLIPIPGYAGDSFAQKWMNNESFDESKRFYVPGGKRSLSARPSDHERRKGVPWTEDEHRQFLLGLKKYGKGDWRNISRNFVTSRTPTQVASHAQKYFIRQLSGGNDKRRSSIHDITTVNPTDAKSTSPDIYKPPSSDKSTMVIKEPQQNSIMNGMAKALYDWNQPSQGAIMAFNFPCSSKLTTSSHGVSTYALGMQDENQRVIRHGPQFGHYNSFFQMQPRERR